jgi:hypothetical protein
MINDVLSAGMLYNICGNNIKPKTKKQMPINTREIMKFQSF